MVLVELFVEIYFVKSHVHGPRGFMHNFLHSDQLD
ncbi:hypothetical protein T03_15856 [Trichinella britovi]|uniref:Uncharacterized protein n=1 Tax=Trichinella britovi TaxID=45882 RepID=A0A0V1BFD5_TRIBR|nr:hypothetical protein T03_15856 [Trichinella britovi]